MKLIKGDTIGIIALAGKCEKQKVQNAVDYFTSQGYKVKLSKNIYDENRYLAGSDEDKITELHKFFIESDIKLILCARGGYGAIRLINKIDYNLIKNNPKPFCGFSDITALLLMIYKNSNIVTYHSPMACSDFGVENISEFTQEHFYKALKEEPLDFYGDKIYKEGSAKGILWGGNLATVVSLCGQDFIPNENFIFFTEDLNEPVYKIDKMFQQLFNITKFKANCKGIILGDFLDVDNEKWLDEYFIELAQATDIPIISGFKITHDKDKITLPIGKSAILDKNRLTIQ